MFFRALHILNASLLQPSPPRFQPRSRSLPHTRQPQCRPPSRDGRVPYQAGVPALLRLRRMMSFTLLCLACRPNPSEHDRPCEPLAETGAPHTHVCGSHMADQGGGRTATLTASSLNLRLNVVSGRACSQSEACGAMEALRRARSQGSCSLSLKDDRALSRSGLSHSDCLGPGQVAGSSIPVIRSQSACAQSKDASSPFQVGPKMRDWMERVPAAEAKKAGNASEDTLLTPSPPILIGREACIH